jgi:hypothetical protein
LLAVLLLMSLKNRFWARHALLAGLVSSVIVVMLSVAVVNEILERRRRRRWSILAQYVMFDLIRNARMIWLGVLEVTGLFALKENHQDSIATGAAMDSPLLAAALCAVMGDKDSTRDCSMRSRSSQINLKRFWVDGPP